MATYTTNLNLKKPAQSDKIRIADINNNMDDIDAAFGAVGNDSVATQLGDIQGAIAIVATGNAHAAIAAGQFVYVKGHDTLDTGLYVATSNISQNGTLSSSNLTADSSGGLNALSDQIGTLKFLQSPSSIQTIIDALPSNGMCAMVVGGSAISSELGLSGTVYGQFCRGAASRIDFSASKQDGNFVVGSIAISGNSYTITTHKLDLDNYIITDTASNNNPGAIPANSASYVDITVTKSGYTALGAVSITGTGTTGLSIQEFYMTSSTKLRVYFRNNTSSAITPSVITATILYKKD